MTRKINQTGLDHIKQWEGLRTTAYLCSAGKLTIGYGHTSSAGSPTVTRGMKITKAEAENILKKDLGLFENAVEQAVKVTLNDNQFATLVSFAFNVGIPSFKRSSLLKKLNQGNYDAVSSELVKWNKAKDPKTGKKVTVQGLVNRRAAEAGLWVKGEFVSSSYEIAEPDNQNTILKPEVIAPIVGAASGMTGFVTGAGPFQWALAGVMVVGSVVGAVYFIKRMRAERA